MKLAPTRPLLSSDPREVIKEILEMVGKQRYAVDIPIDDLEDAPIDPGVVAGRPERRSPRSRRIRDQRALKRAQRAALKPQQTLEAKAPAKKMKRPPRDQRKAEMNAAVIADNERAEMGRSSKDVRKEKRAWELLEASGYFELGADAPGLSSLNRRAKRMVAKGKGMSEAIGGSRPKGVKCSACS